MRIQFLGARCDRMIRGEKEIKMLGQMIPLRAEVAQSEDLR
jgi:metallo-beta-lactamase family protein